MIRPIDDMWNTPESPGRRLAEGRGTQADLDAYRGFTVRMFIATGSAIDQRQREASMVMWARLCHLKFAPMQTNSSV